MRNEDDPQSPKRMAYWDDMEEYWFHRGEAMGAGLFIENSGLNKKLGKEKADELRNSWDALDMGYETLLKKDL